MKGSQISVFSIEGMVQIQGKSKNIEMKYKTLIKFVHELYGTCFNYNVNS